MSESETILTGWIIVRLYITLLCLIVLLAIAFIFGSQNEQSLTLNYLIARAEMTVAQAVSLFTVIGILIGLLLSLMWKLLRMVKPKRLKNDVKAQS